VTDGLAFTLEQRGEQEAVSCRDFATGDELWAFTYPANFKDAEGGDGPRSTPTIHDGRVYSLGAEGHLICLNAISGEKIWQANILADYQMSNLKWGMSCSPLAIEDKIIVTNSGLKGASVFAFDKHNGKLLWKSLNDHQQAFTSPVSATIAGRRQILNLSGTALNALDPATGELLWSQLWTPRYTNNCAQPIVVGDDRVFISSGYDRGCSLVQIHGPDEQTNKGFTAKPLWFSNQMKNKFNSSVVIDNHAYGLDEGILACLNLENGEREWKGGRYGYGQLIAAEGHLIILGDKGQLALVKADPAEYKEVSLFQALNGRTWNCPALADGRLLVRNEKEMACFDLRDWNKTTIPETSFHTPEGLDLTVWATSPMLYNPTSIDVDAKGRIWVAEAVHYRMDANKHIRHPRGGDRIVVLEDSDLDGRADRSSVFVQDDDLISPMGIAVFGNRVVVACGHSILVYTDIDGDARFNSETDKKEVFLTGFGGRDNDHGLHGISSGPDGRWYFNVGNAGPHSVTDKAGWTFRAGSWYGHGNKPGLKSDDGRVYVGGAVLSIRPDGNGLAVYGHNMRNPYDQCINSTGDIFQNDNDDTLSCRITWLMQYGNAGYSSNDGRRKWSADKRPFQPVAEAHWRQKDPGVMPAGDVYGSGAPAGIAFYENGALGPKYSGMLLSCEPVRNKVFAYFPKLSGAGFELRRLDFLSTLGTENRARWFRPSDVTVGPDGSIYIADWLDPYLGGHRTEDKAFGGTIYRIAPEGFRPTVPPLDLKTPEGAIAALKSSACSVRYMGQKALIAMGPASVSPLRELLHAENVYLRARAIWPLAAIDAGRGKVESLLDSSDSMMRITAFRALRQGSTMLPPGAEKLARDPSPAVRREVALSLRDLPISDCRALLAKLAEGYDGYDRWYLEALGTGAEGKETQVFADLLEVHGHVPTEWDDRMLGLTWRLHPPESIPFLQTFALDDKLHTRRRRLAVDALGFIRSLQAGNALLKISLGGPEDLDAYAAWWLRHRQIQGWWDEDLAGRLPEDLGAGFSLRKLNQPRFQSHTLTKKGETVPIDIPLNDAEWLFLEVTDAGDGKKNDWANWAEATVSGPADFHQLSDLRWHYASAGSYTANRDLNAARMPMRIGGKKVVHGIGTHAPSIVVCDLRDLKVSRFKARCAIDDGAFKTQAKPSIVFKVFHDGDTSPAPDMGAAKVVNSRRALPPASEILELTGRPVEGRRIFAGSGACARCHSFRGQGNDIGPDLSLIASKMPDEVILASMLQPSAAISQGYQSTVIITRDDIIHEGMILSEGEIVVLRNADGDKLNIAVKDIKQRRLSTTSMMPSAQSIGLSAQDLADLVSFLKGNRDAK
jgi:putative membrane-bound dehydrogenase-like protein